MDSHQLINSDFLLQERPLKIVGCNWAILKEGAIKVVENFTEAYLTNNTETFYKQYPSPVAFPSGKVPAPDPTETEDCLFLDVLVPEAVFKTSRSTRKKAPVLVWIYGGGFAAGYKTQWPLDTLLKQIYANSTSGMIIVALNYRLGAFGFLAKDGAVANAGLLDQRLALKWVRDHIKSFGGDSKQITVMGESAGASSIMYHLTAKSNLSPATPLFEQAIIQSPFLYLDRGQTRSEVAAKQFFQLLGVETLLEARALHTETLRGANYETVFNAPYGESGFGPVASADGGYIRDNPIVELQAGRFQQPLPMILGHNAREGILFTPPWILNDTQFQDFVKQLFPEVDPAVSSYISTHVYPPVASAPGLPYSNDFDRAALMTSEVLITCHTYFLASAYANETYNYLFDVFPGLHGDDLHYTFGPDSFTKSPEIRIAIQSYITRFTENSDPNGNEQPVFSKYGSRNQVLDLSPGKVGGLLDSAASKRCLQLRKKVFK
ncbi:MAG: hypothetical protein Q9167_007364 [Letrouitia subvulpina]